MVKNVVRRKKSRIRKLARKAKKKVTIPRSSNNLTTRNIMKLERWTRSTTKRQKRRILLSYSPKKRIRSKQFARKPTKPLQSNIMSSWLKSAKAKTIVPLGSNQTVPKKAKVVAKPILRKGSEVLNASEYEALVKQLYELIGNENKALKKAEAENMRLKMELEITQNRLEELHLPLSVRKARARSLDRLSAALVQRLCTFLNDDELFNFRGLCTGFYKGFLSQEIKTARRADSTNMKRLARLAKMGRVFPNVYIVLINYDRPWNRVLKYISQDRFPSMCELVVESKGSLKWSELPSNPNVKTFTVLNGRCDLGLVTKERFPNLEYLTFKPYGYSDLSSLRGSQTITRIDLVNIDLKKGLNVEMVKYVSKTKFPNLKMIGVLTERPFPVNDILAVWSYLQRKHIRFRFTCRDYDFTDGKVSRYNETGLVVISPVRKKGK